MSRDVNDREKRAMQRRREEKDEAEGAVRPAALRQSQGRHMAGAGQRLRMAWRAAGGAAGGLTVLVLVDFGKDYGF